MPKPAPETRRKRAAQRAKTAPRAARPVRAATRNPPPVKMDLRHDSAHGSQIEVTVQTRWALRMLTIAAVVTVALVIARPDLAALLIEWLLRTQKS
jgi:hypothetical protein